MSGGAYNYAYSRVEQMAHDIPRFSPLRRAFAEHLERVAEAMRALEWCDSGDSNEEAAEAAMRAVIEPVAELAAATAAAREAHEGLTIALRRASHV